MISQKMLKMIMIGLAILLLIYSWEGYKENFVSSGAFPKSHGLLLKSIFEVDNSSKKITYKEQSQLKPQTGLGSYKQITNNVKSQVTPCGGTDAYPNMCMYKKIKSVDTEEKNIQIPKLGGQRVGWYEVKN
tara:strand:- start:332 stop:724 length:393 start_codon:yes stop_codon:yes gene_type:complete